MKLIMHYLLRKGSRKCIEIQSSNFIKFLKLGQLKFNKNDNENNIASLNLINENDDILYLRHLHPPLSSMYWSLFIDNDRVNKI